MMRTEIEMMERKTQRRWDPLLLALCLAALPTRELRAGPEIPGPPQTAPVAVVGGTVHPVSGPALARATLLFDRGKITQLGGSVALPENCRVVDAEGRHVYPGLFNTDGSLGLIEINSVRATRDTSESGRLNPNVRAEVGVNPDSELIPVTRSGGVLLNLTAPSGGLMAGTSAVLQLDGWTWEDLTLHAPAGMHLDWPDMGPGGRGSDDAEASRRRRENQQEQLQNIEDVFDKAAAYARAREADPSQAVDLRWEAMRAVLTGEIPLIVAADHATQIQAAVAFANQRQLRLILSGGDGADECAELLREQNVPVIVAGVYRLPRRRDDPYDHAYTLPARLHAKGVTFCIAGAGRFDAANIRNLPQHAAMAAAFGLSPEEALRAVTLSPAEILGVAARVGSLEVGKDATLIVTDGDVLEATTHVLHAFVQGREVDLSNRHTRLWRKYQARRRQVAPPATTPPAINSPADDRKDAGS